jgi:diacylglycerol O-acyltransferase / wax synthase
MSERLSPADVAFFYLETRATPQHVGGIAVFEQPPGGFDYARLVRLIDERISLVPRYRQRMRPVPGGLANPVWVDDPSFDLEYHVRRSALPYPGRDEQLLEFCARIQARLLDRSRPLWEMYLVEGLSDDRVAVVTKTHHSMVDGLGAVDIAQVLLDASPEPRRTVEALWMPSPEPTNARLVAEALVGAVRRPAAFADAVRLSVRDARSGTRWVTGAVGAARNVLSALARPTPPSPLTAGPSEHRRIAVARTRLDDFRQVRAAYGGTIHDVVLATVTGALRSWLLSRNVALAPSATVRALVPMRVRSEDGGAERSGPVSAVLIDLPVGIADPVGRLARVTGQGDVTAASGHSVGADVLVSLSGFAPPTLHALGARAASELTRRAYQLAVTNVPGPQLPLYAAGARMTEMFPLLPVAAGQAVSIALTSYDGGVYFGVNADRDAVPDVSDIATFLTSALADLVRAGQSAGTQGSRVRV